MPSLTDISKQVVKGAGEYALNHRLRVAGHDLSENLIDATVTYNTDVGGSGIEFTVFGTRLQDYVNAPISFWVGYGDQLVPYFVGRIQQARPAENINITSVQAFGPYRRLVGQILRSQETFVGNSLTYVIMECMRRGGVDRNSIEIRRGERYKVQPGEQYVYDSDLSDIINSQLEKASFVGMDLPGGKRLFLPRPRPGANVRHKTRFDPSTYYSFTVTPKDEQSYYSILIFRRDERGNEVFSIEQEIDPYTRFKPDRNKVLTVPDYPGTVQEAGDTAYEMAAGYKNGESDFELTTAINPDLILYDGFTASKQRNIPYTDKIEERVYSCSIDGQVQLNYSPTDSNMQFGGSAIELIRERNIIERKPLIPDISSGVLRKDVSKNWDSWDDTDVTFEEVDKTWERLP